MRPGAVVTAVAVVTLSLLAYVYVGDSSDTMSGLTIDGIKFPPSIKMGGPQLQLVGGGTRLKYNVAKVHLTFSIQLPTVYAAAVYMHKSGSASAMKQFRDVPSPALRKKADFYRSLVAGRFGKALVLIFHRSVAAATVVEALRDSLASRLSRSSLATFREHLLSALGSQVPKGSQLYFSCRADTMHFALDSPQRAAPLKDKTLCSALFDVYLGSSPVSPAIKEGVADGFAARFGSTVDA
eukprot:6175983-Pleurochrysis_carterae.AAC.2